MELNTTKQSIVDSYGRLAKSKNKGAFTKFFACCDTSQNAKKIGEIIGYSEEELTQVPEESNLGVGCGNPSVLVNLKKGDTVIDLGSGAGFDAFIVSKKVGETGKVIGVDLNDEMLQLANKNIKKGQYKNITFVKGDIEELPLNDSIAEHVISNCVINLSFNKAKVFRESYRVLKEGGKLAISDIVLEQELPSQIKKSIIGHVACISGAEKIETYLQYIADAGFKNIKVQSKANFPLELMLADPQIAKIAQEMDYNLDSEEAKDIASRITSVTISAEK